MKKVTDLAKRKSLNVAEERLATPEGKKDFIKATLSCWLGTTMEYVDFALYGLAAGLVFGDVFFPESTPVIALLSSFLTYSVGFIARPIGAVLFGQLGDKYGRRIVLVSTIALMGVSTTLIGCIPSYQTIGIYAPLCLVILRFMQGFGAGAELSGATIVLGEYAPTKHRGMIASIIGIGSNSGTLIASSIWLLVLLLDRDDILVWGWRIPFLASAFIALAALVIRRHLRETPVFEQEKIDWKKDHKRSQKQKKNNWNRFSLIGQNKAFWVMFGLRIGENGPSYLAQGFVIGYVVNILGMSKTVPTIAVFIASFLGFVIIPFSGWLSDRFGRRIVYRLFCFLLILYAVPAYFFLETRDPIIVMTVIIVGMCLASLGIFGVQAAYGVELFGVKNRYSKMALAKELGSIVSGGIAPIVASALLGYYHTWWPIAIYFSAMAAIGFITTIFAPETRGRDLNSVNDAC